MLSEHADRAAVEPGVTHHLSGARLRTASGRTSFERAATLRVAMVRERPDTFVVISESDTSETAFGPLSEQECRVVLRNHDVSPAAVEARLTRARLQPSLI
jgi:hypothetical protein